VPPKSAKEGQIEREIRLEKLDKIDLKGFAAGTASIQIQIQIHVYIPYTSADTDTDTYIHEAACEPQKIHAMFPLTNRSSSGNRTNNNPSNNNNNQTTSFIIGGTTNINNNNNNNQLGGTNSAKDKGNFENNWSCNKTTGRRSGSGNSCSFLGKF